MPKNIMENTTKASIIITTYNRPLYLKRAIQSVLKQNTSYSYEVIVIDDNGLGSLTQQETQKLVKALDHNIVYYPLEQNSGACVARNKGVEIAKGEFIFFLDDDDEFLPNKVETQVSVLQKKQELDGCFAGFKRIDEKNNTEIVSEANFPVVGSFTNFAIKGNCFTPMLCIKKECYNKLNGFDNIPRFQDQYFMLKALSRGCQFGVMLESLHIMYEHDGLRLTNNSIIKTEEALDKIKDFISLNRNLFSKSEWNQYLITYNRMRAITYYIANNYVTRLRGIYYYTKSFLLSYNFNDFKSIFKTLVKF
jgi:glycosyltransferase involved in cell wall biosynthesis